MTILSGQRAEVAEIGSTDGQFPLVVDLAALLNTDLASESLLNKVRHWRLKIIEGDLLSMVLRKEPQPASCFDITYGELPYNEKTLALIASAKGTGCAVYLTTSGPRIHADGIAEHLGFFDGVFAFSDLEACNVNQLGDVLVAAFGLGTFDYVGSGTTDAGLWRRARRAYTIGLPAKDAERLTDAHQDHVVVDVKRPFFVPLIKAARPHQYAKNALIFVPLLTAHHFHLAAWADAILAFVAFSLCASGVYLLNDLIDVQEDRLHPTKRQRPFASGQLPLKVGVFAVPLLTLLAFAVGASVSPGFLAALIGYFIVTNAYTFWIKKTLILDVVTLASLYTLRVFAGAAAIDVQVSDWLLTFSLLIFTALALLKRYVELSVRFDRGLKNTGNRSYDVGDLPVILSLAAAAGMNSVMVIALYVSSQGVTDLYSHPHLLWGLCPIFLYWIARAVMLAHRRLIDEDPVTFALKDSRSWVVGILSIVVVLAAI